MTPLCGKALENRKKLFSMARVEDVLNDLSDIFTKIKSSKNKVPIAIILIVMICLIYLIGVVFRPAVIINGIMSFTKKLFGNYKRLNEVI